MSLSFTAMLPILPTPGLRTVTVTEGAKVKFRASDVTVPLPWSDAAASTLFRIWARRLPGCNGVQERWDDKTQALVSVPGYENSVYEMVNRVVNTIGAEGIRGGYFDEANGAVFCDEFGRGAVGHVHAPVLGVGTVLSARAVTDSSDAFGVARTPAGARRHRACPHHFVQSPWCSAWLAHIQSTGMVSCCVRPGVGTPGVSHSFCAALGADGRTRPGVLAGMPRALPISATGIPGAHAGRELACGLHSFLDLIMELASAYASYATFAFQSVP